ncbi:MAG: hypothetical protein JWQ79_3191 [Mucilaginibacter sp.]|nr:hypothetical protein [Mucilaginibacter sp.]
MNQAVNFYELKTQLADLGYSAPEVADQLREIASQGDFDHAIVHIRRDGVKFEIEMERNQKGDFELLFNNALLDMGEEVYSHYFKPDISADDAINFLRNEEKFHWQPDDEPNLDGLLDDDYIYELNYKLQNRNTMNTQNLSYLQKQLLNLGFGENLNADLEKQLNSKALEFTLNTTQEYNKQNVDYTLHYKAGDKDEMYFFNKYDASLQGKDMAQTFYVNRSGAITAKEAYNMMEGRAVYKQLENLEGEKYHAWLIVDKENKTENGNFKLRPFTENWNYKPERAIDKLDIVGINEEGARDKLMKSLEKGNRHQVTAMKDGKEVKLFLEANPAEHRVNLTNWKGEAQQLEHYKKPELKQDQKKAESQTQETSKKKSRSNKMKV